MVRLHQQIDGTKQKIAFEARRIVRAAENDYQAAASQEARGGDALEQAKNESLDLAKRGLKYDALKRDLAASQQLSDNVLARQKQTDVTRDVQASTIHINDTAVVPQDPVAPRPLRDMAVAVVLGFGFALGAAFFRDYLDTSVGRPADVRRLGLPLLGVIPETTGTRKEPLVLANGNRKEMFAEGYRILRTSLWDPEDLEGGQVLLATSTLAGEGKSLTSLNLALTLASSEERVLLVDADLRRPVLNTLLHAKRAPGLIEVLTGMASPEQAIQR